MNNGRADDALPFFFMVSADIQIIKREARAQLFIIDPIVGLDLFLSDPPPLRKLLHRTVVIKNHRIDNLIIMNSFHVANKKVFF